MCSGWVQCHTNRSTANNSYLPLLRRGGHLATPQNNDLLMEQDNMVLLQLNVTSVQATHEKEVTVQEA